MRIIAKKFTRLIFVFPQTVTPSLNETTLEQIQTLSAEDRQELFITYVPKAKQVWLLKGEAGFVMFEAQGETRLPVFPHKDLAAYWLKEADEAAELEVVALEDFTQTWLPGLEKNSVELVILPVQGAEQDMIMSAVELAEGIKAEQLK